MKYSYHWLKELSGTKKPADRVADLLIRHAFEVEAVESYPHSLAGVVVGEVETTEPHPNADRLKYCRVRTSKKDARFIVCGAPNVAAGQKVAVALPGAVLPGNFEIKETEIRGKKSAGMICSEKELGLGEGHEGILVLPEDAPVGAEFAKWAGLDDTLLDVKILPDRGDALSHQGLAREIAALDGHAPQFAEKIGKPLRAPAYNRGPKVVIADKDRCARYLGLYFDEVAVRPSPLWLRTRLLILGMRPINNIVDITNYLMLLTGQPLHAFDADKLAGTVIVRPAHKGEKITLLDGERHSLLSEDIVIADGKRGIALAGIMGGAESGITEKTKRIFVEIARFDPRQVRRTRTRLKIATDASYRFERGVDANGIGEVARLAAELVRDLSGAKLMGIRDVFPQRPRPGKIVLSLDRVSAVLGVKVPVFETVQYLALDGLTVKKKDDSLEVIVPTRRPDLKDEWNLIEEIGRLRGYEKIPAEAPRLPLRAFPVSAEKRFERDAKGRLIGLGFNEMMTYGFAGKREIELFKQPLSEHLSLANPMNPEQQYLRGSLLPSMIMKTRDNLRHGSPVRLFEWESVFRRDKKAEIAEEKRVALSFAETGADGPRAFYVLKGALEAFFDGIGMADREYRSLLANDSLWHPVRSADVYVSGKHLGTVGTIDPFIAREAGLPVGMAVAEFAVGILSVVAGQHSAFAPLPKYPYVERDISLVFPLGGKQRVTIAAIEDLIYEAGAPLLKGAELFDVFEKDGKKSVAFHLAFGADDRTLASDEVDVIFRSIVMEADKHLGAALHL